MDAYGYSKVKDKIDLYAGDIKLSGVFDDRINAMVEGLFKRLDMRVLADYFRNKLDPFAAGEFYGKIMRAACLTYKYTKNAELKAIIDAAAEDMLSIQASDGEISTTPRGMQPNGTHGSDLWERKYVLLGLWEYFRVNPTEEVFYALMRLALYTASQVGDAPKTPVTQTGWAFCGIESSSILEPIMKLYNMTGNNELQKLGRHIVDSGACSRENVWEAILSGKSPKDIGSDGVPEHSIAKAYEMMSCFEGLLEFYRATGEEKYLSCAEKFIEKINAEEITFLGSGGADAPYNKGPGKGEQWNYSAFEQANPDIDLTMETCVTVTYMKLMAQYYRLTSDARCIDRIEVSAYNALLGAMKPDGSYFEYFPRFNGARSLKTNFSYDINGFPLSCCTANGPMGMAIIPQLAACAGSDGSSIYINLFIPFEYTLPGVGKLRLETDYPRGGNINLRFTPEKAARFALYIRIPAFADGFSLSCEYSKNGGYAVVDKVWEAEETLSLRLDFSPVCRRAPKSINPDTPKLCLYTFGALVLASDSRYDKSFGSPAPTAQGKVEVYSVSGDSPFVVNISGKALIPYAFCGDWDGKAKFACWLKNR